MAACWAVACAMDLGVDKNAVVVESGSAVELPCSNPENLLDELAGASGVVLVSDGLSVLFSGLVRVNSVRFSWVVLLFCGLVLCGFDVYQVMAMTAPKTSSNDNPICNPRIEPDRDLLIC